MLSWNRFTVRARRLVEQQLERLNLDIMSAHLNNQPQRRCDLMRRRTELERAITHGDRHRATTICSW